MKIKLVLSISSLMLLSACSLGQLLSTQSSQPLPCDEGLKTAFKPDALTSVISVQAFRKGEKVFVSDSGAPVTLAADMCMVKLYYGVAPQYSYFDGHSTGGRQGWKIAQDYPDLYDGYLLAAPAISSSKFSMNSFYPQVVMKNELGYTSADPAFVQANFKQKMTAANKLAVQACDKEGLGFLLNPFACSYDPAQDANQRFDPAGLTSR